MRYRTADSFHTLRRIVLNRGARACIGATALLASSQLAAQPAAPDPPPIVEPAAPEPGAPPAAPAPEPGAPPATAPPAPVPAPAVDPPEPKPPATAPAEPLSTEPAATTKAENATGDPNAPDLDPNAGAQPPHGAEWDKRPLPDYDGRGEGPTTASDVLIWIPRGIVFPIYLVSEYVLRWPVGQLVSAAEEADLPGIVGDFFTFGPGNSYGLVPSFLLDFGFRPSIGLYFFGDDIGNVKGLSIRSHGAFGGIDFYRGTATVRYHIHEAKRDQSAKFVQLKGIYNRRPDLRFHGLGPNSRDEDIARYGTQEVGGQALYEGGFWRSSHMYLWGGVKNVDFRNTSCCGGGESTPIRTAVAEGRFALPDLFDTGYFTGYGGFDISADTRELRIPAELDEASDYVSPSGTGVKLNIRGEGHGGIQDTPQTPSSREGRVGFMRYGATLGGFLDLYEQRVVGISAIVDFADPFDPDGQIPFTELVSLGGSRPLRGFLDKRLLGRSSAVAQLEYRWPIWVSLDGMFNYSVGNVFGKQLDGFSGDKLRQSFAFGFSANNSRDHSFELLFGLGTQTFEQGSSIDSFRFVFGSSAGF